MPAKVLKRRALAIGGTACMLPVVLFSLRFTSSDYFSRSTALDWPWTASVLDDTRQTAGPFGTGARRVVSVALSSHDADAWLNQRPFQGQADWQNGPLVERQVYSPVGSLPVDVVRSDKVQFAEVRRTDGSKLLVVDSHNGRAWLIALW